MASNMSDEERRTFLSHGTRTGAVATTRQDGRPHVAPVWFVLDGDDVVFMTGESTVKGRSLLRTGRAAMSVDDPAPPYSFVTVSGRAEISRDPDDMLTWSIRIATRYMGEDQAEEFGRRNAVPTELLVRLHADDVVAIKELAD
jgi:PPOX class probable F420-dependent enzyme